jgi:HEAT repeat protein
MLNEVKRVSYKGEILPFVRDLWNGQLADHNDLPRTMIERDVVRIELADILVQAYRNGFIKELDADVHPYARELAAGGDVQLVTSAVQVLATIDDPADVPILEGIANQQAKGTFRAAILALAEMCNAEANVALARMGSSDLQPDNKRFLEETRESLSAFKDRAEVCR